MRIMHRISLNPNETQRLKLVELGIMFEDVNSGTIVFVIDESSSHWNSVGFLLSQWKSSGMNIIDLVTTKFTKSELENANFLVMGPTWHHGYPQPEDAFGYRKTTYDDTEYCAHCGIGLRQREPFSISSEPKWGAKQILQLNWVFDEFFVTPEAWERVFQPLGIATIPVKNFKTGGVLTSVVQLKASDCIAPLLRTEGLVADRCSICDRVKFVTHLRGQFPTVELPENLHMGKTREHFGSGARAWKEIIISGAVYKAIAMSGLKGANFQVIESSQ